MGPMAFLKLQRLHGVRPGLLEAQPGAATISGLAASWGFLNPGHFARDCRRLFGELPSATLSRSPGFAGRRHGTAVDHCSAWSG
ncbi:helix-turn-helix domain-containing protein [Synechococcus sp. RedBA-s]|uniref:helix-turn-helix domain-containing protein n=1 Tax=Synechococcus sp. RedBA-s TaxID=2823741 RepID=UPI0037DA6D8F